MSHFSRSEASYPFNYWNDVKQALKLKDETFGLKNTFSEGQMIKMDIKDQSIVSVSVEEFYEGLGIIFVRFTHCDSDVLLHSCYDSF